jgi:hypothetical protein
LLELKRKARLERKFASLAPAERPVIESQHQVAPLELTISFYSVSCRQVAPLELEEDENNIRFLTGLYYFFAQLKILKAIITGHPFT